MIQCHISSMKRLFLTLGYNCDNLIMTHGQQKEIPKMNKSKVKVYFIRPPATLVNLTYICSPRPPTVLHKES